MDNLTRFKMGLMVAAAIFFAGSLRLQDDRFRWVAIALLAVALLLRLVKPKREPK